ncbi:MAG: hypothetical protein ACFFD4_40120, partial [Candidatus Odinarchaeota archaeon]
MSSDLNSRNVTTLNSEITKVVIKIEAYKDLDSHALKAREKECIGFLVGFDDDSNPNTVYVSRYIPVTEGEENVVEISSRLSDNYFFNLEQEGLIDPVLGEYIVGWGHSHPGHKLFFSSHTDIPYHYRSFQSHNKRSIGIVVEPTKKKKVSTENDEFILSDIAAFQVVKNGEELTSRKIKVVPVESFVHLEKQTIKEDIDEIEKYFDGLDDLEELNNSDNSNEANSVFQKP